MTTPGKEFEIAEAVWEGRIDGWNTRMVADEFSISVPKALRILKKICSGKNTSFPFIYLDDYTGVEVKDGTVFVWGENADYLEGKGTRHHNWFYT